MRTVVTEVKEILDRLPEESGYEDIQYHLYVMANRLLILSPPQAALIR
ncbi:hypothetical protein [Methylomonas koyamae]|nr:hypothetical protein [Methylomonas koyamae]WNB77336.1 hypothetical protein RI210_07100 [Methylomonas koyamae]